MDIGKESLNMSLIKVYLCPASLNCHNDFRKQTEKFFLLKKDKLYNIMKLL